MRSWVAGSLVFIALLYGAMASGVAEERRVALVIGNGAYSGTGTLANTINDAKAMAAVLEDLGFAVTLATDTDRRAAIDTIDEFSRKLAGSDIAFLFYAGHGMQIGGENFLLPIDVDVSSERSLRYSAIDIGEVVREMERRARVALVVLDACRDNPYLDVLLKEARETRAVEPIRGLSLMRLSGRGAIIAYAAAAGEVAADGQGGNSPYTQALLQEIAQPGVEVGLMFRRAAGRVFESTAGKQRPELLVRLVDEVYLKPTPESKLLAQAAAAAGAPAEETVEIASARSAGNGAERSARPGNFFGDRVLHKPAWADTAAVAPAPDWKPAPAVPVAEAAANDNFGQAQPIPLAADISATISQNGDADWFSFTVPIAGELRLSVDPAPAALDLVARVWNADKQVVVDWQSAPRPGGALDGRYPLPRPGTYFVELADSYNDASSPDVFVVKAEFTPADDPYEPNGTIGSASPIPPTATFRPAIWPRGDADWFKLWVGEPGLLAVRAANVPENLDVAIRLWTLDGAVVKDWQVPPRPGGDTVLEAELPEPGIYAIEMADSYSDQASTRTFDLAIDFKPVGDAIEPNNAFGLASHRTATGRDRIAIFPRGDTDWLSLDVDQPGELKLLASGSPQNLDIQLRVWNANKDLVKDWTGPLRAGGDVETFADLPAPGRYFIEIADGYSDQGSSDLFELETVFTPQPDQYEPNNGMASAAPLTPGGEILFNILPRGDLDWFRVEAPTSGELRVEIDEGPDNLDLHYRVWTADRQLLHDWVAPYRKGGLTEGVADLPRAGSYFIEITDGYSDDRSIRHAVLRTRLTPTDDPLEPNDSYGAAKPLSSGEAHKAYILPRGDTDWFAIEAPGPGELSVVVDEVDPALDIFVRLWDVDGNAGQWVGPPRPGGVTDARLPIAKAGTYRLEVTDGNSDQRSANPFRIKSELR
ncbi:MAG: caspase family protein [Mesorhizobium sp.]|nr:caspase family protein [Mesorhizobium sp.]